MYVKNRQQNMTMEGIALQRARGYMPKNGNSIFYVGNGYDKNLAGWEHLTSSNKSVKILTNSEREIQYFRNTQNQNPWNNSDINQFEPQRLAIELNYGPYDMIYCGPDVVGLQTVQGFQHLIEKMKYNTKRDGLNCICGPLKINGDTPMAELSTTLYADWKEMFSMVGKGILERDGKREWEDRYVIVAKNPHDGE